MQEQDYRRDQRVRCRRGPPRRRVALARNSVWRRRVALGLISNHSFQSCMEETILYETKIYLDLCFCFSELDFGGLAFCSTGGV